MVTSQRLTVEEYLALPEEKPYREYIHGEAVPKAMPDRSHTLVAGCLTGRIYSYIEALGGLIGPEPRIRFDAREGPRFLLPDLAAWMPGRSVGPEVGMSPPTLAVEIRSHDQSLAAQREKCRFYRRHGVDVCWLVDPTTRTVEVFEASLDGAVRGVGASLESPALPGFALAVADIFSVLDGLG